MMLIFGISVTRSIQLCYLELVLVNHQRRLPLMSERVNPDLSMDCSSEALRITVLARKRFCRCRISCQRRTFSCSLINTNQLESDAAIIIIYLFFYKYVRYEGILESDGQREA